jgi:DNA polymerase-2
VCAALLRGWLLDLYEDEADGLRLWFITEEGERLCVRQQMPVTFYAAGEAERLRPYGRCCEGSLGCCR